MKISGQSLIDAMRSFCCTHDELRIYPPGIEPEKISLPDAFPDYPEYVLSHCGDGGISTSGWSSLCPSPGCLQSLSGISDHDIITRAVILEALKELKP